MNKKLLLAFLITAPIAFISVRNTTQPLTAAQRLAALRASLIIRQIQAVIYVLEQQIKEVEYKANGVKDLRRDINKVQDKIDKVKSEKGIKILEDQITNLKIALNQNAVNVYAKSMDPTNPSQNLYGVIDKLIQKINDNQRIKDLKKEILEREREIDEKAGKNVNELEKIGRNIVDSTKPEQAQLVATKGNIEALQQKVDQLKIKPEIYKELDPLKKATFKLEETIGKNITDLSTGDKQRILTLRNAVRRLDLMLRLIRNPEWFEDRSKMVSGIFTGLDPIPAG